MTDRPIIFSGAMVRALLEGRNPWVVAPTFKIHKCNIERMPA